MSFRLNAQNLFFTYPQCPLDKQEVYDYLVALLNPQLIVVAAEKHADGTPHLHAFIRLFSKKNFKNADFADLVFGDQRYHGNYQSSRHPTATEKYVTKGGDFIANYEPNKPVEKSLRSWAATEIIGKKRKLPDLVAEQPRLIFGYQRLQDDVNAYNRDLEAGQVQQFPVWLPNPWGLVLPSFKKGKQRHYWLWSVRPNVGKSYLFARPLAEEFGARIQCGEFTYWNVSSSTRCVILDEYNTAGLRYSALNSMCDGTYLYRRFREGVVQLGNPLIIVLSNQSISSLYPFMNELLYARFKEIKLD